MAVIVGTDVHSLVAHRSSEGARSEELGRGTPDLHSDERDPNMRNQEEHEDQGPSVQQPPESVAERTSGGGQGDGDDRDLIQSEKSQGESRHSGYTIVHIDRYH